MENSNYYTSIKKEWFGFFDSDLERLLGNEFFLVTRYISKIVKKKRCALHQLMKHLESDKLLPDY